MRRIVTVLAVILTSAAAFAAQPQEAPQTARQALLEMFFSKTPGTFEKHLPEAMRKALLNTSSSPSMLQQLSLLSSQLNTKGQLQTFEAGPVLLVAENAQLGSKFEITVERDDLRGDEDEIELSFRSYKNGQAQKAPVFPKLIFTMKPEAAIWRLSELTFSIRVALDDPEFVKTIMQGIQQRQMQSSMQAQSRMPVQNLGQAQGVVNDTAAVASMRVIAAAEATYSAAYPGFGYTCSLSDLDGFGGGAPNEHQAMLIESRLASGKKNGYVYTLSGCDGPPATHYRLTAVPAMQDVGLRAFCMDQGGEVRSAADGKGTTCLGSGNPLH